MSVYTVKLGLKYNLSLFCMIPNPGYKLQLTEGGIVLFIITFCMMVTIIAIAFHDSAQDLELMN